MFEHENSVELLGSVLSALADVEDRLSGPATARRFAETALRYRYIRPAPPVISVSHFNLATYLTRDRAEWPQILAHRLAAVLIGVAIRSGNIGSVLATLVRDLQQAGAAGHSALPADFAALCTTVEAVEGVRFRELMERLVGDSAQCDALLQQVVTAALEMAPKPEAQQ